ncbi:Na+/H+ antiporter subunit E [Halomicrococcus sp. SG-WS-1]|uniref:Na+/H+ antiporter subunit E n=1 Tax=Halomicrococcus sp. SG-WS-1 TaxID=3439057 RepID=UPI003F7A1789
MRDGTLRGLPEVRSFLALFTVSFGFYLLLGEPTAYDAATGAVSAAVVAGLLARVTFPRPAALRRSGGRTVRAALALPVLIWEVAKANVAVAYAVLHPSLPVDPALEYYETDAESRTELATLASAITLTPGTVTVEADEGTLLVHSLTAGSRATLREGRLRRTVAFVFRGRGGGGELRLVGPAEREGS